MKKVDGQALEGTKASRGCAGTCMVLALPNQRWNLDFVHDQLVTGRRFRVLSIADDVTCECLRAVMDISISGWRVAHKLTELTSNAVLA